MSTIKHSLFTNFFLFLCIIHINFFNVDARVTIISSKDQTTCTMCDACDNPCPPVFSPPPPPSPVPDCEPPPSLPPPPSVSDCEPPPSPPTSGVYYDSPPPPAVVAFPYYSPSPPTSYYGSPPPPNPMLPYFPYYWYNNTSPSIYMSKTIQLKICHPIVVFIALVLSFVCL